MFAVVDPFVGEALKEQATVSDPTGHWKSAGELEKFIGNFGAVTRVHVRARGFGRRRRYEVTASPYIPYAARQVLEDTPQIDPKPVRGRHRTTGSAVKRGIGAVSIQVKTGAQGVVNDLQLQR